MKNILNNKVFSLALVLIALVAGYKLIADYTGTPSPDRVVADSLLAQPFGFVNTENTASTTVYSFFDILQPATCNP